MLPTKVVIIIFMLILNCQIGCCNENDFKEFEDNEDSNIQEKNDPNDDVFIEEAPLNDDDDESHQKSSPATEDHFDNIQEDDVTIKEDGNEFNYLLDDEEFVGLNSDDQPSGSKGVRSSGEPKITIAKVPLHLRSNWDSFYLEMLMIAGLGIYFVNFMIGRNKNQKIAITWYQNHRSLLESNFSLIGDDGKEEISNAGLTKESENVYILWCSGRTLVEGMLIEIKLLKRQDLVNSIIHLVRPSNDQIIFNVNLDDMDSFVFAFGTKKSMAKLAKDMVDINTYCPEKKSVEKFSDDAQFIVHSEVGEITTSVLRDPKVMAVIEKFPRLIEYFHFSDQYSGLKQQDESQTVKLPEVKKMLIFCFNFPKDDVCDETIRNMKPLMQLVFYMLEKITRFRLSKEAKSKAEKNRWKVQEAFLRAAHSVRAEMAQTLREEKRRKERERIMSLDDPEKQRKWEEREQKRQIKKRAPKVKTMKVKPL